VDTMKRIILALLFPALCFGSYTVYRGDQGQIGIDPGDGKLLQSLGYPMMGLYGDTFLPVAVDASGELITTGGGSGSNASVGPTGSAVPNSGTYIAGNQSGTLTGLSLDGSGNLLVAVSSFPGAFTANQGTPNTLANGWPVELTDGTVLLGTPSNPLRIDPTGTTTQPISGSTGRTWTLSSGSDSVSALVSNFPATQSINITQVLGSAPSSTNPLAVQISNGSSYVDPTQIRALTTSDQITSFQGGSWTTGRTWTLSNATDSVAAVQSGAWTTGRTWTLNSGTDSVAVSNFPSTIGVTQSTSPWVVSGTVTANQGGSWTVTANAGTNLNTSALALDTSVNGILLAQGSTTSGQSGPIVQGAVTTSAPTYVTAKTNPLSLTTAGALRVDGSGVTQPISGAVTANAGSGRGVLSTFTQSYSSANLSTSSFTTIISSTSAAINEIDIFDSSGSDYYLAYAATCGALSTSSNAIIVSAGGGGKDFMIPSGNCLGFQAKTANITTGSVNMTFYK